MTHLTDRAMQTVPDNRAVLAAELGADDEVLGFASGHPAAYERAGAGVFGFLADPTRSVIDGVARLRGNARHMGGDAGSIAHRLPRDSGSCVIAVSRKGVSLWDFRGTPQPPRRLVFLPRESVASVERLGSPQRYQAQVRFTFSDASFLDYLVSEHEHFADFWPAIEDFGG